MLLHSSRAVCAISKEAGALQTLKSVGKGALSIGKGVGKWSWKNPGKAAAGAILAGGTGYAGVEAGKGVYKSLRTPTDQSLYQRRMEGFKGQT